MHVQHGRAGTSGISLAEAWLVPHGSVPAMTGLTPLDEQRIRAAGTLLSLPRV